MDFMKKRHQPSGISFEARASRTGWLRRVAAAGAVATLTVAGVAPGAMVAQDAGADASAAAETASTRLQAGSLACKGEGGWGAIVFSKKTFDCTFVTADRSFRGSYKGTITKFGLDVGVTGETALLWLVFGPAERVADNYRAGSLAGEYSGVGVEATLGAGVGANALVGGNESQFVLQPVSVQVQTGLSIAAAVQTLKLEYLGELN